MISSLSSQKCVGLLIENKVLLHDTINTKFDPTIGPTNYDTKESEMYTIDLLRKAEQKDLELKAKFLERVVEKAKKDEEKGMGQPKPKNTLKKRITSARAYARPKSNILCN